MTEYRFEFKYLLDPATASQADGFIRHADLELDRLAPGAKGTYPVTSLYFDNIKENDYYDKSGGFLKKIKIRARTYATTLDQNSFPVWLEFKKRHDAAVKKIRCPLSPEEWKLFLTHGPVALWRYLAEDQKEEMAPVIWELMEKQRRPKTLVRYLRRAYIGRFRGSRVRVTFDSNIEVARASPFLGKSPDKASIKDQDPGLPLRDLRHWISVEPGRVVMEVKCDAFSILPPWFGNLIRQLELERISISKYAKSVEMVKWFETLAR